ncbi:UDP-N-acetylmuramate--L-alanine ligase [Thermodesulfatator atlanticus]
MREYRKVHFIGIGGIGMSGLARLLLKLGFEVTGSDLRPSEITKMLEKEGALIYYGHKPRQVEGADLVVYSTAIPQGNPELVRAKELGLKIIPRAQMLVEIMELHRFNIVVAGAHGKTTTSSMLATVLTRGGLSPTVAVGGRVNGFDGNAWLGEERAYLVAEADESDGSFLRMSPDLAIITNIDAEHLDYYQDLSRIKKAFLDFAKKVKQKLVICADDKELLALCKSLDSKDIITYGLASQADYVGHIVSEGAQSLFVVYEKEKLLGEILLPVPGRHNILNALGVVAAARALGLSFEAIRKGFSSFSGVKRRFELKGQAGGIKVFDDYAHHPTEIRATLNAFRKAFPDNRLVVLFQPHRYTRTKALFGDFVSSFDEVDVLLLTEIYPASEEPIPGVTGEALFNALARRRCKETYFAPELSLLLARALDVIKPGDVLITMGAGDIYRTGEAILEEIGVREKEVA